MRTQNQQTFSMAFYTRREEQINSWSHAAGILIGIIFGCLFLYYCLTRTDGWATVGIILYIFGMLTSYIASTVYHAAREDSQMKHILRKWDHAAIYWHIAGSYSPFTLIALRQIGFWGWGLFIFVWFCALIGTIMSFHKLKAHSNLETICFIGMGLSILMAFNPLIHSLPASSFGWLIAEGISDITGALFYTLHKRRYMHSIFHFFILGGSICHIIAVWNMLNYLF